MMMIHSALWIAPAGAENIEPCHFRAEKTINIGTIPGSVTVQIACDSCYYLEINGIKIGRGSARGTPFKIFYDEYEVAPYLRKGNNFISVLCVCMNFPAQASMPVAPALRMALGDLALTDTSWQMRLCTKEWPSGGPLYCAQTGYAEVRDMNYEGKDEFATCIALPDNSPLCAKKLVARDIPQPLEELRFPIDIPVSAFVPPCDPQDMAFAKRSTEEPHSPLPAGSEGNFYTLASGGTCSVELPVPPGGGGVTLVADFGKEISGTAEIEVTSAAAGTIVDIAYEEELFQNDRLRADHTHTNPTYQFADRFILRPGRQTVGSCLMDRGFRMIQLTFRNIQGAVTLHRVNGVDRRYPFAKRGTFFCGDYQLNRLWETAQETLSACTTDIFTDCPWRERLFYSNDFLIENRTCLKMFGDLRLLRRAYRLIFSSNRADCMFTSCAPSSAEEILEKGKTDFHVILSGELMLLRALWEYYLHTDDIEIVKECLPQLRKMLEKFQSWLDDNNILRPPVEYWNFFDWSFELNGMTFSGKRTSLLNFAYIIAVKHFNQLAGKTGEEPFCSPETVQKILDATIETFFDYDKGYFRNSLEDPAASMELLTALGVAREDLNVVNTGRLTHALALLAGAEKEYCHPLSDSELLTPELYYSIFILDAMEEMGTPHYALAYIRRHWGAMLDSGTPTLWENGVHKKGKAGFGGSASLCHGFSTSPAAFLQSAVLGVKPLEPGFRVFSFDPLLPEVEFAQGHVPTPHGAIRCSWRRHEGRHNEFWMTATLHVPDGCKAKTPAGEFPAGDHELSW